MTNPKADVIEQVSKLVSHPVIAMIGGCTIVELLQHISIDTIPATPGGFSWNPLNFGFHPAKPAQEVALLSQPLGSAIEIAILLWGAGKGAADIVKEIESISAIGGKLGMGLTLLPKVPVA